jgi:DNA polymerase
VYLADGAESLIWTFAGDERPVQTWDVTSGAQMPNEFEDNMLDERVTKVAHNAPFDNNIARVTLGLDIPWDQWWCTMSQSYAHGLPGSLEVVGMVLGLPADMQKMVEGKKLIDLFCKTPKGQKRKTAQTHPVEWRKFLDYAAQDTAALREIYKRLPKHNYTDEHRDLWVADMEINERGFHIDQALCAAALSIKENMEAHLSAEITELTGGVITKGTQRARILNHIVGEYGELMLDMTADTIKKALARDDLDPDVRRLLELRRDSSLSSLAKYNQALKRVGPDGRMRHTLQYAGAGRTGRWGGRGFQPHNMPRPKREPEEIEGEIIPAILDGSLPQKVDDVNQACKDALRGAIVAAPGNELIVGDWSNIEGCCRAWEAEEQWQLDGFFANFAGTGPDMYNLLYSKLFAMRVEDVDKKMRQKGKAFELAFGYGGGVGATVTAAATYGIELPDLAKACISTAPAKMYNKAELAWKRAFIRGEDFKLEPEVYIGCDIAKQLYRQASPNITQMWWDVERACRWAIERPGSVHQVAKCTIWRTPKWLIIELPSGRRLMYATPTVKNVVEYDEETEEIKSRPSIRYMAAKNKQWHKERTYGGKIIENITQGIANDVLRTFLLRARADGWPLILHVHDEGVAETPIGLFSLDDFLTLMERPLWWADGLPLKAAGYVSQRYRKD